MTFLPLSLLILMGISMMPSSFFNSNNLDRLAETSSISEATLLFDYEVDGDKRFYNYCPSIFEENGVRYIYYCTNKEAGNVTDYIGYREGTFDGKKWVYSDLQIVLSPESGMWDQRHVCDPSVIKGQFTYNGQTYNYLMNYLASSQDDSMGNGTGFAVATSPSGPWIKCYDINPFIPFNSATDVWGNGQTSMINLDGLGHVLYFYSYGGKDGTYEIVREYDLSNLNDAKLIRSTKLSLNGLISGDITINDAEFVLDKENEKLLMVKAKHPYVDDDLTPTFISSSLILYMLDLSGGENLIDKIFSADSSTKWEYIGEIDSSISGFPRNHNPGLVTDAFGFILTDKKLDVIFSTSITNDDFWTYLSTYRLYQTSIPLSYGKFSMNRLNSGAKIALKQSTNVDDLSTIRVNLSSNSITSGEGLYFRFRNYTTIDTPIDMLFENSSGYKVKPTQNAEIVTYDVNGDNKKTISFREFGNYLMLPAMFDGYIYIPFSSLTSQEEGERDLSSIKYIYLTISNYYDYFASFSLGDIFSNHLTNVDVSSLSMMNFNSTFLVTSNSKLVEIHRLPTTDFDPAGHDLLGGIRMTMNRDENVDRPAQWILKSSNADLAGEGLYFRLKNNHFNPYYLIFYLLDQTNHRMALALNAPIFYYDCNATLLYEGQAREFGSYFYVPGSFDGFIYIPYSSLTNDATWSTNTYMHYDKIAHIYLGASSMYDYLLDITFGDVFTTNSFLYDGSESRYDDFALHAEKVWEADYVNIEYAEGYKSEATCYGEDFLSDTYPCYEKASIVWNDYKVKFNNLSESAKNELISTSYAGKSYDECTIIEQCVWRYDLAVKNQGLEDFMNRNISLLSANSVALNEFNNYLGFIIFGAILLISCIPCSVYLYSRGKEKEKNEEN